MCNDISTLAPSVHPCKCLMHFFSSASLSSVIYSFLHSPLKFILLLASHSNKKTPKQPHHIPFSFTGVWFPSTSVFVLLCTTYVIFLCSLWWHTGPMLSVPHDLGLIQWTEQRDREHLQLQGKACSVPGGQEGLCTDCSVGCCVYPCTQEKPVKYLEYT